MSNIFWFSAIIRPIFSTLNKNRKLCVHVLNQVIIENWKSASIKSAKYL